MLVGSPYRSDILEKNGSTSSGHRVLQEIPFSGNRQVYCRSQASESDLTKTSGTSESKGIMDLKLTDKTALVSGSTKGIGFAIATGLPREGARVIVNGRSEKSVAEAKGQIEQAVADANTESFAGDLSTAAATETLLQRFPLGDILVNNLGIFEPKPFEGISDEDWRWFFEVNVLSGVRLSRAYLPRIKQRDVGRVGFIRNR